MKLHTFLSTLLLLLTGSLFAQAPQAINYQAVVRDINGNPLLNRSVQLRFTIAGNGGADVFYQETHNTNSDALGGIHLAIGDGTITTGNFSTIDWKSGDVQIVVEMDPAGGQNFVPFSTTTFNSVPYALYAHEAGSLSDDASIDPGQIGGGGAFVGQVLIWNGNAWVPGDDKDEQTLTINGNQLAISNGNAVTLPTGSGGGDDWGSQVVETDLTIAGDGTLSSPLELASQGAVAGEVLKWNGSSWEPQSDNGQVYVAGQGISINGNTIANTGDNDNSTTNEIQTLSINGQVLSLTNGGSVNLPSGANYTAGTGINIAANVISAQNTQNLWNANQLQGRNVSATAPVGGQVLTFNPDGTGSWFPGTPEDNPWNVSGNEIHYLNNVGIGVLNPASRLHIVGGSLQIEDQTITKYGSVSLEFSSNIIPLTDDNRSLGLSTRRYTAVWATDGTINTSDAREKRNIQPLQYGLQEILKIKPVSFEWTSRNDGKIKLGILAQDVAGIIPEVVVQGESEDDRLGVYYSDLIPVLIKAIQEQEEKIKQLQAEIEILKQN